MPHVFILTADTSPDSLLQLYREDPTYKLRTGEKYSFQGLLMGARCGPALL